MTAPLLTITLNPALDITTGVPRVMSLRKLRCETPHYNAGGGGVNVSRAMGELGVTSEAFVVLGGSTGQQYRHMLDALGLVYTSFEVLDQTRVSFTAIDRSSHEPYRFVLPGPELRPKETRALLLHIAAAVARGSPYVVASGSVPPGIPDDVYARIARMCRKGRQLFVVDSSGPALAAALEERPHIVRFNHHEARELVGGEGGSASAQEACSRLIRERKAEIVIVSIGEQGTLVANAAGQFQISPPHVEIGSTVGAGDSFVAALMVGLTRGWPLPKAATYGVAAAASAVAGDATQLCKKSQTDSIYRQMIVQLEAVSPV
jgi:6-phosphofructokinase 2